jgi:hypothetical protein
MAMSKSEQKAASDRIMAKLGPMTPEEQATYGLLTKTQDEYIPPDPNSGLRKCVVCSGEFLDDRDGKGNLVRSALDKYAEHSAIHNPSPGQWGEAHRRIQAGKERSKNAPE